MHLFSMNDKLAHRNTEQNYFIRNMYEPRKYVYIVLYFTEKKFDQTKLCSF